ncbi:MurR/RpiR family transcriptional regulator [Jiella pelagia]|uniref:MurR/RpiR family transcriptional regulator n=1 Tax=Jiella pelagia TaxID=2986949 RepID=A0ABY7BU35_9HYPH|nr:MurR/RpiR family transcriptional regulator [Jiella pelagia]WAP66792.1 MurR/RpiR family transcriptional regulator [Jiella pelagia]
MAGASPPLDYEGFIRLVHERYDGMSKTYQRIATFLTQNPNEVAVSSANAVAERSSIHPSSFVRFAQSLGYSGFKELQALFQKRLSTAAPGFEARVAALKADLATSEGRTDFGFLRDLVIRDIASLQALLEDIDQDDLSRASELLHRANTVYLLGQLRSAPIVDLFRYVLTMLGKRCVLLDMSGGLATHVARTIRADDVLLVVSFRFYANEVVSIVNEVSAQDTPIIAISDSTLSPLTKSSTILFAIPEHDYTFSRSLAAPMCFAQALTLAVAARVQGESQTPRIPAVTSPD